MQVVIPNLVSTIIPVHNREEMLVIAVNSVLQQSYRPIEVIIVDDGSTDGTPGVGEVLVKQFPGVVRLVLQENEGPGPARERGRSQVSGEFIQYLDSDDRLLPNKFTDQVAALRANPGSDIAYGMTRLVDESGATLVEPFKWTGKDISTLFPGLLVDRWWCTHTPLYRRSLTDRVGPWCDMRWSQDWEYDARVGAIGTQLVTTNTFVSEHCQHSGTRQTSSANWGTDPERLSNRVQLLEHLWKNYQQSGLSENLPEVRHFSRWCFLIARQCALQSLEDLSNKCLDLASEASQGYLFGKVQILSFRALSGAIGYRPAAILGQKVRHRGAGTSKATMKQSFSK